MSSKKKPLMIKFRNADPNGGDVPIIFKNGALRAFLLQFSHGTLSMFYDSFKVWETIFEVMCRY